MSRLGLITVLCDVCCQGTSPTIDAIRDYHQSGDNIALRSGGDPGSLSKAGVFHTTSASEHNTASHGEGTAYCGNPIYCRLKDSSYYSQISSGIGTYITISSRSNVPSNCRAGSDSSSEWAHCYSPTARSLCPKGWGNRYNYFNYLPGCNFGTYYPNPTPASDTNAYTGSQTTGCHMLDALTLCESYFGGHFPDRAYSGVFYTRIIPYSGGSFDGSLL